MNKQLVNQQVDFVRCELTRISQDILYLDGSELQALRVRQNRLVAELSRLELLLHSGTLNTEVYRSNLQAASIRS